MLSRFFRNDRRPFDSLSEQEILALAISSEEDDARIYLAYADGLRDEFPQSAKIFEQMAAEEHGHRDALIERHKARFGDRTRRARRGDGGAGRLDTGSGAAVVGPARPSPAAVSGARCRRRA